MEEKLLDDDKLQKLLEHNIHHNEHHASDLDELIATLNNKDKEDAVLLIKDAKELLLSSVSKLKEAMEELKK